MSEPGAGAELSEPGGVVWESTPHWGLLIQEGTWGAEPISVESGKGATCIKPESHEWLRP